MQDRISPYWMLLTLALSAFAPTALADSAAAMLTVNVSNIQAADMMFVKSKSGKATCVFESVKLGKYTVSVMHDEDGELKTNLVGRPKEWRGVSNNVPPERFGPPKYEAASFSYGGEPKTIQVKLRL